MPSAAEPVLVLCGGRGTRLQEHAQAIPKPLVEIGGMPIVWHVVRIYAAHGHTRFWLLTGYKGELIQDFVRSAPWPAGLEVGCVDTGLDTPTGGRVHRAGELVGAGRFAVTYADGLADVDLGALQAFHAAHGALATVTLVRPELPFGIAHVDGGGRVTGFAEKPRSEHWVNGGFFLFEPGVLGYLDAESVLERRPLERLAADGQLRAHRHEGFWECMDTYKDAVQLNDLWAAGEARWAGSDIASK
ncbi:MAG: sugar phosphate nucleotidyltransferase [Actinomycetota bacterium]|nr:sugar phosphate nucleotidyltransferase [Actinomycetota bacterium]